VALGLLSTAAEETPRHFLLMAGAGLDADIVYGLNQRLKDRLGKVAYWLAGWSKLGRKLPEFRVTVDGRDYESSFALVSRVRNYGGDLEIAPSISLLDEEFEVVLFEGASSMPYVKYMLGTLTRRLEGMRGVTILRATKAVFSRVGARGRACAGGWRIRRVGARARGAGSERVDFAGAAQLSSAQAGARRRRMDNLTHTLTGLLLSRTGLNRHYARSGFAADDRGQHTGHRYRRGFAGIVRVFRAASRHHALHRDGFR
jgi:hypothetical protein